MLCICHICQSGYFYPSSPKRQTCTHRIHEEKKSLLSVLKHIQNKGTESKQKTRENSPASLFIMWFYIGCLCLTSSLKDSSRSWLLMLLLPWNRYILWDGSIILLPYCILLGLRRKGSNYSPWTCVPIIFWHIYTKPIALLLFFTKIQGKQWGPSSAHVFQNSNNSFVQNIELNHHQSIENQNDAYPIWRLLQNNQKEDLLLILINLFFVDSKITSLYNNYIIKKRMNLQT